MMLKIRTGILGIATIFAMSSLSFASGETSKTPCVPEGQMLEIIEKIPKYLPYSKKDNVYTVISNSNGALTVTVEGLAMGFFDSRNSDPKKWGSVSNNFIKDSLKKKISEIGCVAAGINNYDTGKVDSSPGAKDLAQKSYNEYVKLTQPLLVP